MSKWSDHVAEWGSCTECRLHSCRKKIVLGKGKLPCEILFIGEAPGISEDVLGLPFVGPAGKLLDQQISLALNLAEYLPRMFWTNLVGCIPKEEDSNRKAGEPTKDEIKTCWPRVQQLIDLAKPKVIITVGDLATKQVDKAGCKEHTKVTSIRHPAFILRANPVQQNYENQQVIVRLSTVFRNLMENH